MPRLVRVNAALALCVLIVALTSCSDGHRDGPASPEWGYALLRQPATQSDQLPPGVMEAVPEAVGGVTQSRLMRDTAGYRVYLVINDRDEICLVMADRTGGVGGGSCSREPEVAELHTLRVAGLPSLLIVVTMDNVASVGLGDLTCGVRSNLAVFIDPTEDASSVRIDTKGGSFPLAIPGIDEQARTPAKQELPSKHTVCS